MKTDLPPCGLYLRIPESMAFDRLLSMVREAAFVINRSAYERSMHVVEVAQASLPDPESLAALVRVIQRDGLVALLAGNATTALNIEADGVVLDDPDALTRAREAMGDAAIIGLACRMDREKASKAVEFGADCVLFGSRHVAPPVSLIDWWSSLSPVPAVALGAFDNNNVSGIVAAGASFADCSDYVWSYDKGVKQAVVNMLHAIDLSAGKLS